MKDINKSSPRPTTPNEEDIQTPVYLTSRGRQESKRLQWWYRLTAPSEPDSSASFNEIEHFRRGQTGSQILLGLYFLLIIAIPAGIVGTNKYLVPIVIGSFCALILATILNRIGKITLAGILVVLTFIAFPSINIITTPGGLSMLVLPLFGLLVLPLLCAVSFLPPWWVFVVALGNCLFTWFSLMYLPHTAELDAILAIASVGIVTPIFLTQIIVSIAAYAWIQGTTQALIRANHAEELAKLEHDLGLQAEMAAQQKRQLEASIQTIVQTHMSVANGNFSARVPLTEGNVLWQISGPLNNLLARTQHWRQEAAQVQKVNFALQQAREEIAQLRRNSQQLSYQNPDAPKRNTGKSF